MTRKVAPLFRFLVPAVLFLLPQATAAQDSAFTGPGLLGGLNWAAMIGGPSHLDAVSLIINIVAYILDFLTLAAVIVIIIAGIRLVVSQGEEEQKEKAKKTIIYACIGLIVVLLSRIIVMIVATAFSS